MRRIDKEIKDQLEINEIFEKGEICRISFAKNNIPYVIPVNYGYCDNCIFIHSAKEGKKIDLIKQNNLICFEITTDTELIKNSKACTWGTKYKSIIGMGNAFIIDDFEEKEKGLAIIMKHYTGKNDFTFDSESVNRLVIIKIEITQISAKKSGF